MTLSKLLQAFLFKILPFGLVGLVIWALSSEIYPGCQWQQSHNLFLKVLVVNYTVPFDNYKEHQGVMWLLDHLKVPPPADRDQWDPAAHYVGYDPTNRDHPRRLSEITPLTPDVIFIADTYGVYRDDLKGIADYRAHMDYNPLLFGGLNEADARALTSYVDKGGTLIAEFNTFCEPTEPGPRAMVEQLLGLRWTGWVGRVFTDPHNKDDVPWWFPRQFAKQYPDKELPTQPILLFVQRGGKIVTFTRADLDELAPQIVTTASGRQRFPAMPGDAPFFFWFAVMEAHDGTDTHAELVLPPSLSGEPDLAANRLPERMPLLTERVVGRSRRLYFAADLVDVDFDLGDHMRSDIIERRGSSFFTRRSVTTASAYWRVFAPAMRQVLSELAHRGQFYSP